VGLNLAFQMSKLVLWFSPLSLVSVDYKLYFSMKISGFNLSENQLLENCLGYHFVPTLIFEVVMGWIGFECWAVLTPRLVLKPIIKLVLQ
jgi:hypothetical protein